MRDGYRENCAVEIEFTFHVCLRLGVRRVRACVRVRVRMCASAFPSRSLIKATLKSSGASAVQPLHLFFRLPYMPPWGNLNRTYL